MQRSWNQSYYSTVAIISHQKAGLTHCLRFLYPLNKVLPFLQLCGRSNQDLEICLLSFMPSSQSTGSRGPRMSCSDVVPKRVLRGQRTATKLGQIGLEKIIHNNPHVFSVLVFTSIIINSLCSHISRNCAAQVRRCRLEAWPLGWPSHHIQGAWTCCALSMLAAACLVHAAPFAEAAATMSATSKEPKPVAQRTVMSVPLAIRVALMMSDDVWWPFPVAMMTVLFGVCRNCTTAVGLLQRLHDSHSCVQVEQCLDNSCWI